MILFNSDYHSSGGGGTRRVTGFRLTDCVSHRNIMICFEGPKTRTSMLMNMSTRDALEFAEMLGKMAALQQYEQSKEVPF